MKAIYFSLIFTTLSFCQTREVKYNIHFNSSLDILEESLGKNAVEKVKHYTTSLIFNDTVMQYFANSNDLSSYDNSMLEAATYTNGIYYKSNTSSIVFQEEKTSLHKDTILSYHFVTNWHYFQDEKVILGYTCKKATCVLKIECGDGKETQLYTVTAWYTEKLPFGFGPKGINIPNGFILELEDNIITYQAISIETIPEKELFFDTHKKIVTMQNLFTKALKLREKQ